MAVATDAMICTMNLNVSFFVMVNYSCQGTDIMYIMAQMDELRRMGVVYPMD